jgi:predicted DNA-binding transcriptional regulator YafY
MTSPDLLLDDDDEPPPDRRLTTSEQKLQRWVDLLAALLIRHLPATFDELAADVPGYDVAHAQRESVLRTFERDKDELRRFGVPIETVNDGDGETVGYLVARKAFYLPYLMVSGRERAANAPHRPRYDGYRSLETLAFEPDELDAIIEAAGRVRALGDPVLAAEAEAAIRKLALDLPLGAVLEDAVAETRQLASIMEDAPPAPIAGRFRDVIVPPRHIPDLPVFEKLSDALARRKAVSFDYYTMERGEQARRRAEPYGLFFLSSHWYLAARDVDRGALRNFRLSRISHLQVNTKRSQSPDYEIPVDFVLREHARSREPWEIGDGDVTPSIVDFLATTGATQSALGLGRPVQGSDRRRQFDVRRLDAFARWLLSFGGDARPVEPPALRAEYDRVAAATLRCYTPDTPAAHE